MIITNHIKILLSEYECVIVPDFGAFISNYKSPEISEGRSTIPSKDILFNSNLTRNDGLLINAIVETDKCSYEEAKNIIISDVKEITSALEKGECFSFEGIGIMALDEAGFIQFTAAENNTCLLDAYGLPAIHLEKISKENTVQATSSSKVKEKKETNRRTLIPTIAAAAVVAIVVLINTPTLTDKALVDRASISFDVAPINKITLKDEVSVTPKADEVTPSLPLDRSTPVDSAKTQEIAKTEEKHAPSVLPEKTYHIIIASLLTQELADEYVNNIKKLYDYNSIKIVSGNDRYRVSVAQYYNQEEATSFVETLRTQDSRFDDAWILPLKYRK